MTRKITDLEGRHDAALKRADKKPQAPDAPTPWGYRVFKDSDGNTYRCIEDSRGHGVAHLIRATDSEKIGNLFAAAPELLEAAKALLASMIPEYIELDSELFALQVVVKKAEGSPKP